MTDPGTERLARLAERDYLTYVETYAETPGVEVVVTSEVRYRRGIASDHEYLNAVFGAHLDPATASDRIAEVTATLGGDGRPFFWTIWPSDGPPDLAGRLEAAGFEDVGTNPLMTLDLTLPGDPVVVPPGLVVREATDLDDIRRVAAFAVGSIGAAGDPSDPFAGTFIRLATEPDPRLRLFGGDVAGELVTCSALFTGTGVAGIYAVATDEAHRGRGYGGVLTAAAMDAGRSQGFDTSVLMASDLGEPVYRRLGFREVGLVRFLRWPGQGER
jgi:GNAT superfamily N-acetyltransferase